MKIISQVFRKGQDSFILKTCEMRWTIVKFGKRGITTICRLVLVMGVGFKMCVANFQNTNYVWVEITN